MGLQSSFCQGHNESGDFKWNAKKQDVAGNFIFGISARPAVCFATTSIAWKRLLCTGRQLWNEPLSMARPFSRAKIILFPGNALTIGK